MIKATGFRPLLFLAIIPYFSIVPLSSARKSAETLFRSECEGLDVPAVGSDHHVEFPWLV